MSHERQSSNNSLAAAIPAAAIVSTIFLVRRGWLAKAITKLTGKSNKPDDKKSEKLYTDPNFPLTPDLRVHHLNVKRGEVANRVLSVGDHGRAERLSQFLSNVTVIGSSRGFKTFTGLYNGVPVSIVATGMGTPMMDFIVRETRAIVDGDMAFIRYGTCGGLRDVTPGCVVLASRGAIQVTRNADAIHKRDPNATDLYNISKPAPADEELSTLFGEQLKKRIPAEFGVREGLDVTADSFYSSQGRITTLFEDKNDELLSRIESMYADAATLEMETYQLYELAASSKGTVRAAAAAIPLANRFSKSTITVEGLKQLEMKGGEAALRALTELKLGKTMKGSECVW